MSIRHFMTSTVIVAALACAAPAYSQILGGQAAGGLGGTLSAGLGSLSGAGQGTLAGSIGATPDVIGRVGRAAQRTGGHVTDGVGHALDRTRNVAATAQNGAKHTTQAGKDETHDLGRSFGGTLSAAGNLATAAKASPEQKQLELSNALNESAAGSLGMPSPNATGNVVALTFGASANAQHASSANASASQPAVNASIDVSASAQGNVSPQH